MTHLTGFPCPPVRRGSRRGVLHHKRTATQRAVKGNRPSVARGGAARGVRGDPGPRGLHRAAGRAGRAGPRAAIKWVIINAPWY